MRLCLLCFTLPLLHVSAASKAQTITLHQKNISITAVFEEIMKQTDYDFVYAEKQLSGLKPINISVRKASIKEVLDLSLKNQPLSYSIEGKNVIVDAIKPAASKKSTSVIPDIDILGIVVNENGTPLAGATVTVKGLLLGATTDVTGKFILKDVPSGSILVISFIGYKSKEIPIQQNLGTIQLEQAADELQEVEINAGFYTVKERERTGNITKISFAVIEKQPISNTLQALQNRVPGMQITQTTGVSGGGFNVQIRGRSSINAQVGNDPMYIIDGVTYPSSRVSLSYVGNILGTAGTNPLSMINPNDIESIDVLKDADATAIYGSRGANGVILIKTKRGQSGKAKINAGFTQGISQVASRVEMLNTEQYLQMRREAIENDGKTISSTDYDLNGTWDQGKYTDWQKTLIGGTAPSSKGNLNISGGTEQLNYLLAGNYYREGTVYPGRQDFNRVGLQSSVTFGSNQDRFNLNFSANYNRTLNNQNRTDLTSYITLAPNTPGPFDEFGQLNWANNTVYQNPMAYLLAKNRIGIDNLLGNVTLSYRIVRQLTFKASAGYNLIKTDEFNKLPLAYTSPANNPTAANRIAYFSNIANRSWVAEPQLNYSANIAGGELEALIGMSLQENVNDIRSIRASNFSNDELMENLAAAGSIINNSTSYFQYRYIAGFGRLNYSLKDKYFLNLTGRRDGSSRFGKDKKFANFGAVGAAWIFSEEPFLRQVLPVLSFGKLRASYGITGNDQIPDYGYLQLYNSSGTYQGMPTVIPSTTNIGNPDFAWETNRKLELALQLSFLKDKINVEASWYRNRSSNQLIGDPLPLSTGSTAVRANRPAIVQNMGWEVMANGKIISNKDWEWSSGINITIPKNRLLAYPDLDQSSDADNLIIGKPLSIAKIYNVKGVNPQTGFYDIEDHDGNGVLDANDRYLYKFTGLYFYGGLQNSIRYKSLSLDFLIGFTKQNGNNYMASQITPGLWSANNYPIGNQTIYVLDRWKAVDDIVAVQKFTTASNSTSSYNSAKNFGGMPIADASYIRLKNVSLNYALNSDWLSRIGVDRANLSLSGQNTFTVTNYRGLDPETQSMSILPPLKTWALTLNLTF